MMRIHCDRFVIKRFGICHLAPIALQSDCVGTAKKRMGGNNRLSIFWEVYG